MNTTLRNIAATTATVLALGVAGPAAAVDGQPQPPAGCQSVPDGGTKDGCPARTAFVTVNSCPDGSTQDGCTQAAPVVKKKNKPWKRGHRHFRSVR